MLSQTLLTLAVVLFAHSAIAQEHLPSMGVLDFKASGVTEDQAYKISKSIETSLYKTGRFKMVTRELRGVMNQERENQKNNVDETLVEQGKAVGANYIVKGMVSVFKKEVKRARDKEGRPSNKVYTRTRISYSINIIDVKTGIIKSTDTYKGTFNGVDHHIRNFIRKEFPIEFSILEILSTKGDKKAKNILLDGGYKQGLIPGVHLEVYEVSEEDIEGYKVKREVKVGHLYVKKLDTSGNFALCKIHKGKKSITKKLNEGANLVCKIPKGHRMFWMNFEYEY